MIVLIDDDPLSLISLEATCEELAIQSKSFTSPREALEYIKDTSAAELIICDYQMPEMTGIEVVQQIQSFNNQLPCIIITAHDSHEVAVSALEIGAYDYITKPIDVRELAIIAKRALNHNKIINDKRKLERKLKALKNSKINMIGESKIITNLKVMADKVSKTDASVLVTGETGTGKEVVAKYIHDKSLRAQEELVSINCAAIPENLLESELFGHTKGAFTGAEKEKVGLFEQAHKGTLFLDEIGDMSYDLQTKLLRALQESKIRKIGDNKEIEIDVRVIAATHNNLIEKIKENNFREDLYYRLNVVSLKVPNLTSRKDDIPLLCDFFLKKLNKKHKTKNITLSKKALLKLMDYSWPGNVRELENVIERSIIMCNTEEISDNDIMITDTFNEATDNDRKNKSLEEIEKEHIQLVLQETDYVKEHAAQVLKINRKTLYRKIKEYDL